mmetsp:Transcript_19617/g.54531  ORF Transcript_19617/g.54531 Transcript_19617/m.54531 type:complete len:272 (-) Transcript_19617:258-1073(-)
MRYVLWPMAMVRCLTRSRAWPPKQKGQRSCALCIRLKSATWPAFARCACASRLPRFLRSSYMSMPPSLSYSSSTSSSLPLYRVFRAMLEARFLSMSRVPSYFCSRTRSSRDFLSSSWKYRSLEPSDPYLSVRLGMRFPSGRASTPAALRPKAPGAARPRESTIGRTTVPSGPALPGAATAVAGGALPERRARRASATERFPPPPPPATVLLRPARRRSATEAFMLRAVPLPGAARPLSAGSPGPGSSPGGCRLAGPGASGSAGRAYLPGMA